MIVKNCNKILYQSKKSSFANCFSEMVTVSEKRIQIGLTNYRKSVASMLLRLFSHDLLIL